MNSASLTTLGFGTVASRGKDMQRIDPGWLVGIGASIGPLWNLSDKAGLEAATILKAARDAVGWATTNNIYVPSLKQTTPIGERLLNTLNAILERVEKPDWDGLLTNDEKGAVLGVLMEFQGAYITEMRNAAIYYIPPHSGFDIQELIDHGERLFPKSLGEKVSEATRDVKEGAKAFAYEAWTASGYHFHRVNEAVLRRYFDHVAGSGKRKNTWSMGTLLFKMTEWNVGKKPIIAAEENIVEFHRNPLLHPEHFLDDAEAAVSLYTAIRSAVGYMLDELPAPPPPIQVVSAPTA